MRNTDELLVNIKEFMQRWFPLTTEVNNNINTQITSHDNYANAHSELFGSKANTADIPTANNNATNIKMNGNQSAGSLSTFAKADHIHPNDTSKVNTNALTWKNSTVTTLTDVITSATLPNTNLKYNDIMCMLEFSNLSITGFSLNERNWSSAIGQISSSYAPPSTVVSTNGRGTMDIQIKVDTDGYIYFRPVSGGLSSGVTVHLETTLVWRKK